MSKFKDQLKETIIYLLKKKTLYIFLFTLLIVLAVRINFTCEKKNNKWDIKFSIKNLDNKIPSKK